MNNNDYWKIVDDVKEEKEELIEIEESTNIDDDFYSTNLNNIFNNNNKENVLCVGQVQSGKTKNIEKIISYGIENKYDLIVFLAGITNLLLNQTINRIRKTTIEKKVQFINSINRNTDLFMDLKHYENVVIPILKSSYSITNTFNSIDKLDLRNKKVLIIDDECDYASINVSRDKVSKIYLLLKELYKRIYYGKLISFTGTPFANIMCSKNQEITPDRVVTLINYDEYCGLKYFNKNANLNYIEVDFEKNNINDNLINYTLYIWLVSTSCALIENDEYKSELLINIEVENYHQKNTYDKLFNKIRIICKNPFLIKNNLKEIYYKYFWNLDYDFEIVFEKYKKIINYFANNNIETKNKIILLNSENKDSSNFKSGNFQFCIIVSGFMASRGFTFENLLTELFLNVPNKKITIDTLLQRCRWFGPRLKDDRVKYLKIIINKKTKIALEKAEEYIDIFKPGTSTINIENIYKQINELDKENNEVESTNGTKRR